MIMRLSRGYAGIGLAVCTTLGASTAFTRHSVQHAPVAPALPLVHANDNRVSAGTRSGDTLALRLVVQMAEWRPEADSGSRVAVAAFAEEGRAPQIPAPLIRSDEGTLILAAVRNALADSTIGLIGLGPASSAKPDTLFIRPGETRQIRYVAGAPGTYLYRAIIGMHSPDDTLHEREQVAGALVVDPHGAVVDDRVFVINVWGELKDSATYSNALTINGRAWPWTERLDAVVGDTMHWRIVNASNRGHPMHLHGAYFRVDARGDGATDSAYAPAQRRLAVTEVLHAEQTMAISWSPVRAGRWLFHCHIAFHVIPAAARLTPAPHGGHDELSTDPLEHMAGLALGIEAREREGIREPARRRVRRLDLYVQQGRKRGRAARTLSYVMQQGATPPAADSAIVPGAVLVLTRGEPTDVTIHNRLTEPTAVHWHGLELESYSDGVPGWSGTSTHTAPSITAGGTFVAHLAMPRAGTFIYHTHMRDLAQLTEGLYGAIVVLAPGQRFDPRVDHVFVSGWDWAWNCCSGRDVHVLVNGDSVASPPLQMHRGETHRFRFVNIGPADAVSYSLRRDSTPTEWRAIAKDGADLPSVQATLRPATVSVDVGETYDFAFTPTTPGTYTLSAPVTPQGPKGAHWTERIIVH